MGIKLFLGIFVLMVNSYALAKGSPVQAPLAQVDSCFTPDEIKAEMALFQAQKAAAIEKIPVPVEFIYSDIDFDIGGYGVFSNPKKVEITFYGRKCKNGLLQKDELQLLMCHELGHAAGGSPYINFPFSVIEVSAEGQADYYATSECLPALWGNDDNRPYLNELENHPQLAEICTDPDDQKRGLCYRMAVAGLNFSRYVFDPMSSGHHLSFRNPGTYPELGNFDPIKVKKSYLAEYPTAQCRLETYLAGIHKEARPECWFNPELPTDSPRTR